MDASLLNIVRSVARRAPPSSASVAIAAAIATVSCSDMTRGPLQPGVPSTARTTSATAVGFIDEFETFDLSRWSKEAHPLGRGTFEIQNIREGTGTVSLVLPANTFNGGEIRSIDLVGYGTYTASMRTPLSPGSITAFFLYEARYLSDEIDIEIYNDGSKRVLLTTWVRGRRTGNVSTTLPSDPTTGFHEYVIDWSSSSVRFYVDGAMIWEFRSKLPRNAMHLMANTWWPTWLSAPLPQSDAALVIDRIAAVPR